MLKQYLELLGNKNFNKEREQINRENRIGLDLLIIMTSIFLTVNVILRFMVGRYLVHQGTLLLELIYFCPMLFFYFGSLRKKEAHFTFWIYAFQIPVMLIALYDAIHYEAASTTFIFMVFLLVFPIFILDKPWRVMIYIVALAILYAVPACFVEPSEVYAMDMIHLVDVCMLSIGSSTFFLIVRLRVIRYAGRNAERAEKDPLTGLYNRSGAEHHVDAGLPGIFVYIDLDKFKGVNDEFGHEQGDHVLQETAAVLRGNFRRSDVIIRLGGDEFAVSAPGKWSYEEVEAKMRDLLDGIREMTMADSGEKMTASIGCAYAPNGGQTLDELTRMADRAMYEAKRSGKNGFRIVTLG